MRRTNVEITLSYNCITRKNFFCSSNLKMQARLSKQDAHQYTGDILIVKKKFL